MKHLEKKMQFMGFLQKFIDIYFYRMANLGFSKLQAFNIINTEFKENNKNETYTNVFDVIEKVKNGIIKELTK